MMALTSLLRWSYPKPGVFCRRKRVYVDFPTWMVDSLDREASKLGVTRQSVIKGWLAERLQALPLIGPHK